MTRFESSSFKKYPAKYRCVNCVNWLLMKSMKYRSLKFIGADNRDWSGSACRPIRLHHLLLALVNIDSELDREYGACADADWTDACMLLHTRSVRWCVWDPLSRTYRIYPRVWKVYLSPFRGDNCWVYSLNEIVSVATRAMFWLTYIIFVLRAISRACYSMLPVLALCLNKTTLLCRVFPCYLCLQ